MWVNIETMNKETISIGNLVKYNNEVHEIEGIFLGFYDEKDYTVSLKGYDGLPYVNEIKPIPFDESYLEKLGLEHDSEVWSKRGLSYINGEFYLSSVNIGKLQVHQVQNLLSVLIHQI